MKLTEIIAKTEIVAKELAGGGKVIGRLGLEVVAIYGLCRFVDAEPEQALYTAATYGIFRNAIDALDALHFKSGRIYDWLVKPISEGKKNGN
jgi:hypothetical protein